MTEFSALTEIMPEGEQTVAPGVAPITLADRLALRAAAPMQPARHRSPAIKAWEPVLGPVKDRTRGMRPGAINST